MGQRDICLKRYLSDAERFADLINGILGEGERLILPSDLTDMDSQVGYHGWDRQGYRDILKKAAFGMNFLVIGIENQEHTNYLMPLRCLSYDASEYERQAAVEKAKTRRWKKMLSREEFLSGVRKETKLHPCITIVLYFGEIWDGPTNLREMLDFSEIPERLRCYVNDYPMYLVNVRQLQDTSMFQTDLKLVFDCIRFSKDKERLYKTIQENEKYFQVDEDAYDVIARYSNVFGERKTEVSEGGKMDMCKAMQDLREDWIAEGKAEERRAVIVEFLKGVGMISEEVMRCIMQECDLGILREWSRIAAQAMSVQEFERAIQ